MDFPLPAREKIFGISATINLHTYLERLTKRMLLLKADIPNFVESSQYLQSLLSEGSWPTEGLEIPDGCAKKDLNVSNDADLLELLTTIRYWLVPEVAVQVENLPRYALMPAEPNDFSGVAADFGADIPFVGELLEISLAEDKVERACWYGRLSVLKILCEELSSPMAESAGLSAVRRGHVECLQYLRSGGYPLTRNMLMCATEHGQLACLQFLVSQESSWSADAAMYAAKGGNLECIQNAISMWEDFSATAHAPVLISAVARGGHFDCVKLLLDEPSWPREACLDYVMRGAASGGHLEILQYGLENTSDRSGLPSIMSEAAGGGHIDCMQYLHAQGCAFDAEQMMCAAAGGHLDAMKFLHAQQCPWRDYVCQHAATNGHLECLKFAHENGCPWTDQHPSGSDSDEEEAGYGGELIAVSAVKAPTVDCLEYVLAQGAYLSPTCSRAALFTKDVSRLRFLHARGLAWDAYSMIVVTKWGWFEGAVFLHEIGVPWNEKATEAAASIGHMTMLLYALQNGCAWSEETLEKAISWGDRGLECVQFMEQGKL